MSKGQLFSTDLLFGVVLLIFGLGILIGAAEMNMYNQKQELTQNELINKTILAAQIITNSNEWDCNFDTTHAAYSINKNKFYEPNFTIENIKQKTNLVDYNIRIVIGEEVIYNEIQNQKNVIAYDLNILTCNNSTTFNMLKYCMNTGANCYNNDIKKEVLSLMVAK